MAQATSGDVLLAILALDAYNRGPTPGYALDESQIGNATFASDINDTLYAKSAASADFYAAQYTLSGSNNPLPGTSTVIAYRGTDFNGTLGPNLTDVATGWTLSAGYDQASQAQLAKDYYTYVTQSAIYSTAPSNVFLTGHSLGELSGEAANDNPRCARAVA